MASPNHPSPPRSTAAAPVSPTGGGFFSKSILFGMFLLALPLFPSQAPDFVGETVLTKFWELIHLLFVGIAVAYGLFSRRNVESPSVELRMSCVDESSLSYVSRVLQVSSVFDDEEKEELLESSYVSGRASVVAKEMMNKSESLSEYGEINQVQAWNSRYFQGRSKVVVVARPAYGLDSHVVHQSLGLPVRSLRSGLRDNAALEDNGKAEEDSLVDNDEVMAAAPSSPWHSSPEMMGMEDDFASSFQPLSVDETRFTTRSSRSSVSSSSSSSRTSFESHDQKNRFSPSRSVSGESLNSNVDESVKDKSLQGSSRSSSPSLPPSPPLSPSPPSPELVTDDTHRRVVHSRHYSDGSLLEEDVRRGFEDELLEGSKERGFSKKETGSKSLKLTAESSWKGKSKSRRSYPPDIISSPPVDGADHSTTRRRYLQQKSDSHLFIGKRLESDHNKVRVKKGRSHDSLELTAVNSLELQPRNDKLSRRGMRSARGGSDTLVVKDKKRKSEDDDDDDKSSKKDVDGDNKEVKSNSPRYEQQSRRGSSKVSSRGKSVRTIRSDRNHGDSSDDKAETKPRRQWQQELAIVLHQEKHSEPEDDDDDDDDDDDVMEEKEAEQTLEEEEEEEEVVAWESQSNASNEVDKKADEFIAKFREQIRLQKLHSGEQRRGGGTGVIRNSHFR